MPTIYMNGQSEVVALTAVSARTAQLTPGRYLVRVAGLGANTAWLLQGDGAVVSTLGTAGETPFLDGAVSAEFEVYDTTVDAYVAGIMSAGTATLVVTPLDSN